MELTLEKLEDSGVDDQEAAAEHIIELFSRVRVPMMMVESKRTLRQRDENILNCIKNLKEDIRLLSKTLFKDNPDLIQRVNLHLA
jgi:hypothetical protein